MGPGRNVDGPSGEVNSTERVADFPSDDVVAPSATLVASGAEPEDTAFGGTVSALTCPHCTLDINQQSEDGSMAENRGGTGDRASRQGDGDMSAPGGSGGTTSSGGSGGMRAPSGAGGTPQRGDADSLGSRTDRGNQNDEGIGSSASRGGGGGEATEPRSGKAADRDALTDTGPRFGEGSTSSGNPDVAGTKDEV